MSKKSLKELLEHALGNFFGIAFAVAFYFFLLRFSVFREGINKVVRILMPFVFGGVMAYLLKKPCNLIEDFYKKYLPEPLKKRKTGLAVLTVLIIVFIVIYTLIITIVPQIIDSIKTLTRIVPTVTRDFFDDINAYLSSEGFVQSYIRPTVESLSKEISVWADSEFLPKLQSMLGMVGNVTDTLTSIVQFAGNLMIGLIVCIYALCARKKFARQGKAVIYSIFKSETADKIMRECYFIDATFGGFISGKILDSAIVGIICYAFCLILGLVRGFPNAMLISVIIGLTNIIPYFGPFIGAVPSVLLITISDPINAVIFLIFVIILQQFDGNVLGPKLLADSVGLSGFWVLFAITLFSGIFGFAGVLIGVPVFAVLYDFAKKLIIKGLQKHDRMDLLKPGEDEVIKDESGKKKTQKKLWDALGNKITMKKGK